MFIIWFPYIWLAVARCVGKGWKVYNTPNNLCLWPEWDLTWAVCGVFVVVRGWLVCLVLVCFFKSCPELFTLECYGCVSCLIVSCPLVSRVLSLRNSLLWNLKIFLCASFCAGGHPDMLDNRVKSVLLENKQALQEKKLQILKHENIKFSFLPLWSTDVWMALSFLLSQYTQSVLLFCYIWCDFWFWIMFT